MIDSFLSFYGDLKEYSNSCQYADEVNTTDGVVYPFICKTIPSGIKREVIARLSSLTGRKPENPIMFLRRSPEGCAVPHQCHSNQLMGKYSLMLYLCSQGGTAFMHHMETGIAFHPNNEELEQVIVDDQNNSAAWFMDDYCPAIENRACIFEANRIHRADPIGGFGQGNEARTVLTCFYS